MPKAMLVRTAMLPASTPAAPLMPQNQGVGRRLICATSRIPVGKPKPIRNPAGARIATASAARSARSAPS